MKEDIKRDLEHTATNRRNLQVQKWQIKEKLHKDHLQKVSHSFSTAQKRGNVEFTTGTAEGS